MEMEERKGRRKHRNPPSSENPAFRRNLSQPSSKYTSEQEIQLLRKRASCLAHKWMHYQMARLRGRFAMMLGFPLVVVAAMATAAQYYAQIDSGTCEASPGDGIIVNCRITVGGNVAMMLAPLLPVLPGTPTPGQAGHLALPVWRVGLSCRTCKQLSRPRRLQPAAGSCHSSHQHCCRRPVGHQRHLGRQCSTQPLAHGIDSRQLLQPVNRPAAVHVPVMIKFALVRVDHGAIATQGCIDDQRNPQVLGAELNAILANPAHAAALRQGLALVKEKIGPGGCSQRVAQMAIEMSRGQVRRQGKSC